MGGHTPSAKSLILGKVLFLYELKLVFMSVTLQTSPRLSLKKRE